MERRMKDIMYSLIRSAILNENPDQEIAKWISAEDLVPLFKISSKHDVAHLIGHALIENGLIEKEHPAFSHFSREIMKAVYRYNQLEYELSAASSVLDGAGIPFMPLKGSVLRSHYPTPWMRTSCDVDILVSPENADRAAELLSEKLGYIDKGKNSHDIQLYSKSDMHIELHFDLIEEDRFPAVNRILSSVWDTALLKEGTVSHYLMPDELFFFYHIAHMAKHFEAGGCGVRPFIDIFVLESMDGVDTDARMSLLSEGGLYKFADNAVRLSRAWFSGGEYDDTLIDIEDFVLNGGVYGNTENRVSIGRHKKGGALAYALSRIFVGRETLKYRYPILERHGWLTPFMQVPRWFSIIFSKRAKRAFNELKMNSSITKEENAATERLLAELGL